MFCTKPGTKTQLVHITFPCMKQQISTPQEALGQEAHSEMRWPCSLSACRSSAEARHALCFPSHSAHAQRPSPGWGSLLLPGPFVAFTRATQPQPPWCLPRIWRAGSDQAAELPTERELPHGSGGQQGGSSGLHPCVHAAQQRTRTEQHVLLQVHPYCHLLSKKREMLGGRLGIW